MAWSTEQLDAIAEVDEVTVVPEGGPSVVIWFVEVEGDVYIRSYRGRGSRWFAAAVASGEGRFVVGDIVGAHVVLTDIDDPRLISAVSESYEAKYRPKYSGEYVDPMLGPGA
ncbi:DUF2255 family protein [Gryllotalpicola sp.]|uniref:DUF2255 family protein n=1 Tax=Gryllotalpicola sp. TaxID=1932787 RepID=UPI0026182441|nr:DUF2255 family protein [Gryllotalpicola sp.]